MADFIPVHADLGPGPARNIQSYDEFLTTTIPTKSLGPCTVPFYHRDPGADEDSQIVRSLGNWRVPNQRKEVHSDCIFTGFWKSDDPAGQQTLL